MRHNCVSELFVEMSDRDESVVILFKEFGEVVDLELAQNA